MEFKQTLYDKTLKASERALVPASCNVFHRFNILRVGDLPARDAEARFGSNQLFGHLSDARPEKLDAGLELARAGEIGVVIDWSGGRR